LLVEDDIQLRAMTQRILSHDYRIDAVDELDKACDYIDRYEYDVALIDRNLHGEDVGLKLITKLKQKSSHTGVIVISSYGLVHNKIEGLNQGADDYIEKPFDFDELRARIEAIVRRFQAEYIQKAGFRIDIQNRQIFKDDAPIALSNKETELLFYLLLRENEIVSKEALMDAIYQDPESITSNTIDAMIKNIRKKLNKEIITTIKTRGYQIAQK
jgi:DNA-binding response OmpR family regulator